MIPEPVLNFQSSWPVTRVDRLEPPLHRAVEDDVAGGDQGAAPGGEELLDLPARLVRRQIPGGEEAAVAAGAGVHPDVGADERRAGDVVRLHPLEVHAQVVVRHVEQPGARREGGRLPVLGARRRRADLADGLAGAGRLRRHVAHAPRLQVDAGGGGDEGVGIGREHLAGRPVHDVDVAVALGAHQHLAALPVDVHVEQHELVDAVVVEHDRAGRSGRTTSPGRCRRRGRRCRTSTCCPPGAGPGSTARGCRCRNRSG